MKKPVVLVIVDGLGIGKNEKGNAFINANTPMFDELLKSYPNSTLHASGVAVGLPKGQMGNSEVGHLNIGAGQIVYTGLTLIQKAIEDGSFYKNEAFLKSVEHAKKNNSTLHVMGLLSPGGVHSLEEHLYEVLKLLHNEGLKDVSVHAFTDGRDVKPRCVKESLKKLKPVLDEYGFKLASIQGRLYAMDRDAMFEKTEKAFEALKGNATNSYSDVFEYIDEQYAKDLNDEFIEPGISKDGSFLKDNDAVIFFNFRPDRARQLSHLIVGSNIYPDKPKNPVSNVQLSTMMKYVGIDKADVAFDSMEINEPIGKVLSDNGLKQLRIAETQKYAHVTFFMDGGKEESYPGMDKVLINSPKVDNFSVIPEMSAKEVTDKLLAIIDKYDVVLLNYANTDMVGHTGVLEAAQKAVEFIDSRIALLKEKVDSLGGTLFITADHGNAEEMLDANGNPATKHTTNDVVFIATDKNIKLKDGSLANIAPTLLDYLGIDKPKAMDHESLIVK